MAATALKLFLLLNLLSLSVSYDDFTCSPRCKCNTTTATVTCVRQSLIVVPKVPRNVRELDVSWNYISSLQPNVLTNLHHLALDHNRLDRIPTSAFRGLRRLSSLILGHNRIRYIDRNAFKNLKRLKNLNLRYNKIFRLEAGTFENLHQLQSLWLDHNKLRQLASGNFRGLKALKYLYLFNNEIQKVDPDVFQDMIYLKKLFLDNNKILALAPNTFSNLPSLSHLYLHRNLIQSIPHGAFQNTTSIAVLRLDPNFLICDCHMMWLAQMLTKRPDMQVRATCYNPPRARDILLQNMNEHDFQCQEPEIMNEPSDITVNFGEDAIFTCTVSGEPTPVVEWYHGVDVVDNTRYDVIDNGTLMIHKAEESDSGYFECVAKNTMGEARSRAKLVVNMDPPETAPQFTITPESQLLQFTHQPFVQFDCAAEGNPRPHISWLFNNEMILQTERISMTPNNSLIIKKIQIADSGVYTCWAKNIHGSIKAKAELEVSGEVPTFTKVSEDKIVNVGERVDFVCAAKSTPDPTIFWMKESTPLNSDSEKILLSNNNEILSISNTAIEDAGTYICIAKNEVGVAKNKINLQVKQVVSPRIITKPGNLEAYKGTSVQIPCEVETDLPAIVEWRKDGSRVTEDERIIISAAGSLILNNLTMTDSGSYECFVFNEYGHEASSGHLIVKDYLLPGEEYVNVAINLAAQEVDEAVKNTMDYLFNNNSASMDVHQLFRITRFPNAPAREMARAAEIYERTLDKVKEYIQAGRNFSTAKPFSYHDILSREHLELISRLSGCSAHRELKNCSDICYHSKYRSIDGTCNNLVHPTWGSSLTGFRRIIAPEYENGFSQPIGWNRELKYNGFNLPSARLVSTTIISTKDITEDVNITHMVMQWGQWLDHDMDHALPSVSSQTWGGVDCKKTCDYAAPCFPIDVPANDSRITNRRCIDFIRTSAVCGSGLTSAIYGNLQVREQINQLTSYIDGSQVYGFEKSVAQDLRDLRTDDGLLRVGMTLSGKKPLLPTTGLNAMDCRRNLDESTRPCFVTGDIRANEQIGLAAMHTIWMREHNRIAKQLRLLNPSWTGERIYQETRKILGGQMQFITYEHWLPLILGSEGYKKLGKYTKYDPSVDASVSNVFATAALRFGHTMINPELNRYDENFETIPQGPLKLRHAFFSPWRLVDEGGVDPLLRGMFSTPAKLKTPTQNLNSELTEKLFYSTHAVALDLAAINIQRGREHGIPSYTKWREFCNMSQVHDFDDLKKEITSKEVREKLRNLYGSVHNIDVWVGGILENTVEGGKVGPLISCLLIEQFSRLRDGDRFWYENPNIFSPEQLAQIKKTSLARVLCDNGDNIDTIPENVFLMRKVPDDFVSCDEVSSIDLTAWIDCDSSCSYSRQAYEIYDLDDSYTEFSYCPDRERLKYMEVHQHTLEEEIRSLNKRINMLEESCNYNQTTWKIDEDSHLKS